MPALDKFTSAPEREVAFTHLLFPFSICDYINLKILKMQKNNAALSVNKKARHLYELSDFMEAGIELTGSEVKSIRTGKVNFVDSYVNFKNGEAWLVSLHIAPYANAGYATQIPDRDRRLLLHAQEIARLAAQTEQKGLTVVPVKLYFRNGRIKVEIALGRGKKLHDHRETLKKRAAERDAQREMIK